MKAADRQLLKHDKYAETVVSGLQWAKKHQSKMIAAGAALVIIAGAIVWTLHSRMQTQQDAQTQLTQYEASADSALRMKKGDARTEAVKDALSHLDGLVNQYPDSDVAPQALLRAAELLSDTGEPAKAGAYFERLVEMSGAPEGMKALARRGWAASLEQGGDVEKAIVQYKVLAEASSPQEAVEADWDIGRCYELLKDPENAKSFYGKAIEAGPETKWAELARFRNESLARGPMTPESAAPAAAATGAAAATTGSAPAATASEPATTASMPEAAPSEAATSSPEPAASEPAAAATSPEATEPAAPK